eukprot:s1043_g46.t1
MLHPVLGFKMVQVSFASSLQCLRDLPADLIKSEQVVFGFWQAQGLYSSGALYKTVHRNGCAVALDNLQPGNEAWLKQQPQMGCIEVISSSIVSILQLSRDVS